MAVKLYGSLVGTPLQNMAASGVGIVSNRYKDGMDEVLWRDLVTTAGNVIGDAISLGVFRSSAYIDQGNSFIWPGAAGAGATLQIGDAAHPVALGTGSIAAGTAIPFIPTFLQTFIAQPLWQRLGYPTDPFGTIELLGTFAGANPANVNIAWQVFGRNT